MIVVSYRLRGNTRVSIPRRGGIQVLKADRYQLNPHYLLFSVQNSPERYPRPLLCPMTVPLALEVSRQVKTSPMKA